MTSLTMLVVFGLAFLAFFAALALTTKPILSDSFREKLALQDLLHLDAVSFTRPELLFDSTDYESLRSIPQLHDVAKQLKKGQRKVALLWLGLLGRDVRRLWRFWRFLIRSGAPMNWTDELNIAATAALSLALIAAIRLIVFLGGPFLLKQSLTLASNQVGRFLSWCALAYGRIPSARRLQMRELWEEQILAGQA